MRVLRGALSIACLLAALALPAAAEPIGEGLPDLDPLDPASCDHEKGFVVVALHWVDAWDKATQSGALEEPRSTQLAAWFVGMENYLIESDDVKGTCLALVEARLAHKF